MKLGESSLRGEGRCSGERIGCDKIMTWLLTLGAEKVRIIKELKGKKWG